MSAIALTPEAVLEAVVALTRDAAQATTVASVADAVVRIAGRLTGADQGALGVIRDDEVITIAALMPPRQPVGSHFPVGFGVAGWVAATARSAEIQDVRQDKRYVALPYPEVRSFVGVPLQIEGDPSTGAPRGAERSAGAGGTLLGVLSLAAWHPGAFAPRTAESLAPFADAAAVLLRSAAQHEALLEKVARLEHATGEGLAEALHELKAPLHSAAGFLELVATEQTGPLNEQQKDFLNTARGECGRLKSALVAMVEAEAGAASAQRPLDLQVVQPTELVDASVERMRGQAAGRTIHLIGQSDPQAQSVTADKPAILQVFANFLQNALRIAPDGSEIVVGARAAHGETHFTVADRGPGLAEYELESIFERFSQGRLGKREVGQVGLGLSISRRIVEQHRGRIWAENREDGGACFCFALPTAA